MTNITPAEKHNPSLGDKYFIDTNVWLYLFFPQYSEKPQRHIQIYSELLKRIKEKDCLILNNFQLFSEFINAWFHISYKQVKSDVTKNALYKDFKSYRSSIDFAQDITNASLMVNKILSISEIGNEQLNKDELKALIKKCTVADLNDIYYVDFCKRNKLKLITHDYDFKAIKEANDIVIISANNHYFNS